MAVGQMTEAVEVTAAVSLAGDRLQPARPGHHERAGGGAAPERPRILVARAADHGRAALRPQHRQRLHRARGLVQRQRPAQHLQQLPPRRPGQQRLRHQQPGLLEPGDAAAAGRGGRVQGRHQQHERGVRTQRRRHHQRGLRQRDEPLPGQRLGVPARHVAQRHRLLQAAWAARSRPWSATSSAASSAGPIVKNRAFFFVDYEGFRQTRKQVAFVDDPDAHGAAGDPGRARAQPDHGRDVSRRHADPDDAVRAARSWPGCPTPRTRARRTTSSSCRPSRTTTTSSGPRSTCRSTPASARFARVGYRNVDIFDQPPLPLPSGGSGNGFTYVKNQQLASGLTWTPGVQPAPRGAPRRLAHRGGQEPARARAAERARRPSASRACPPTRA